MLFFVDAGEKKEYNANINVEQVALPDNAEI